MKICEWCRESYGLGGPEKHEANECRAILKAKSDATLLQIDELKANYEAAFDNMKANMDLANNLRSDLEESNRLNYEYRSALEKIAKRWCWCKQEDLAGDCAKCTAESALSEKRNHDVPHSLAGVTQCGTWTEWGQCVAEKPCKVHG